MLRVASLQPISSLVVMEMGTQKRHQRTYLPVNPTKKRILAAVVVGVGLDRILRESLKIGL